MVEFLTSEEIKVYYDRLIHKPGYIKTLKRSINEVKVEQILSYAREVNDEAVIRIEREHGFYHSVSPYNFPPCSLFTDIFTLPNGIKLDAFTYRDQLKYWIVTSNTVIGILEEFIKKPRVTLSELALLKYYNGEVLKKDKSKLYGEWSKYHKKLNRTGVLETEIKNKNKVRLFIKVIDNLSGEAKKEAEDDLSELKTNIKNQGKLL